MTNQANRPNHDANCPAARPAQGPTNGRVLLCNCGISPDGESLLALLAETRGALAMVLEECVSGEPTQRQTVARDLLDRFSKVGG